MKRLLMTLLLASSLPLMAALPPLANSLRELRALTNDPAFYEAVGSADVIESIQKTDDGYLVTTNFKQVAVTITYHPLSGRLGPAPFDLTYEQVQGQ